MCKVSLFLADGFEEIEGLTVVDLLRRAGIEVETISIMGKNQITGAHNIKVEADKLFEEADFNGTNMLVLPGGMPGTLYLKEFEPLRQLILEFHQKGEALAAICAAPTVFGDLGILNGKSAVCYPGMEEGLVGAEAKTAGVLTDGNITTSRGLGTAIDFALQLITILIGKEAADKIANSIVYKRG